LPDFLQNPVSLMIVVLVFTVSNEFQHESGLWATTLMGIVLANQKAAYIHHIIEFKENLRVLLLSALFILLAARVELSELVANLNWKVLAFLGIIILVARPLSVYASSLYSNINWKEKLFLSWMAPRGVVAASISSIFAISLTQSGFEQANQLVPIVFIVIICTVAIYGLPATWVARKLGVAKPVPNGLLILGAKDWSISIAKKLKEEGIKVLMADSNRNNASQAKSEGLDAFHGNVLSEFVLDDINLDGIGKMVAFTPNDEVNSLATLRFSEILGRSNVFQIPSSNKHNEEDEEVSDHLSGRILFNRDFNYQYLSNRIRSEDDLQTVELTADYTFEDFKNVDDEVGRNIPLFHITSSNELHPFTIDYPNNPTKGDKLIYIRSKITNGSVNLTS